MKQLSFFEEGDQLNRLTFSEKLFELYARRVRRMDADEIEDLLTDIDNLSKQGKISERFENLLLAPLLEKFFSITFYYHDETYDDDFYDDW